MRRVLVIASLVAAGMAAQPAIGSPAVSASATVRIVVAPVTESGHAGPGFTVRPLNHPWSVVDCNFKSPSAGAISPNIEACGPSAAYAIACWKAATPHRVLCIQDLSRHKVVEMKRNGKFAKTKIAPARDRAPLLIILTDGTRCGIRDGGAWPGLKGHPNLYVTYSCDRHGAVWLKSVGEHSEPHLGIDESNASWIVRTAGFGAKQTVRRHIASAYFVATAAS